MYQYICSICGAEFSKEHDREKQCPHCGSIWILISYNEDGIEINVKEYAAIRDAEGKVKLKCPVCGNIAESFGHIKGTFCCECGGMPLSVTVDNPLELLKGYRKKHKLSQKLMGWKLGMSQGQYSKIESGTAEIPNNVMEIILKLAV